MNTTAKIEKSLAKLVKRLDKLPKIEEKTGANAKLLNMNRGQAVDAITSIRDLLSKARKLPPDQQGDFLDTIEFMIQAISDLISAMEKKFNR